MKVGGTDPALMSAMSGGPQSCTTIGNGIFEAVGRATCVPQHWDRTSLMALRPSVEDMPGGD